MRGFTDPRVLLACSLAAWSCAKATDDSLAGGAYDPRATGGTGASSTGGSFATGGSFSTGGSTGGSSAGGGKGGTGAGGGNAFGGATTGGSNTSGGTTSAGGSTSTGGTTGGSTANGGTTSAGGSTSTGGTGTSGTTSEGGATTGGCAGDAVPPVLADADVVIHYVVQQPAMVSEAAQMRLFFENKSSDPLPLKNVRVRYWMSSEAPDYSLHCYYAAAAVTTPTLSYDSSGGYIEAVFSGGSVPAVSGSTQSALNAYEFQVALQTDNGEKEQQDNDWSFDSCATDTNPAVPNPKITAYVGSKLVWGCEPGGSCAGASGEGGAGGQGEGGEPGQAGQGGQPAQGGTAGTGTAGAGGVITAGTGGDTSAGGQAGI